MNSFANPSETFLRLNKTYVGRAARDGEPCAARQVLVDCGERVVVEEALPVERHADERGVVERELEDVPVLHVVWVELEHLVREEDERDCGACLQVPYVERSLE